MKPFKDVIKDQRAYHKNPNLNTVHRSSLIAPKIEGFDTYISFLNHFLIKRGYESVFLRITPYKNSKNILDSISFEINEPKVYSFKLEQFFKDKNITSYDIEFFSSKNLFIPFPAVIINHLSDYCINSVHSYSRTLNDLRENNKISKIEVKEASFEFLNDDNFTSFIIFQKGIDISSGCKYLLEFELFKANSLKPCWKSSLEISDEVYPLNSTFILLKDVFKDLPFSNDKKQYCIKVKQPKQFFFYGRLLSGLASQKDNAFSANHSYYDNSTFEEYFDNQESYRTFPFFENNINDIIIHPINSPTKGRLYIVLNYYLKGELKQKTICEEIYNNDRVIHFQINKLKEKNDLSNVKTFTLIYKADEDHKVPARFSIQLIYGGLNKSLNSSINNVLNNISVPIHKKKIYKAWIQIVNHPDYVSNTGICLNDAINDSTTYVKTPIHIKFYTSKGLVLEKRVNLLPTDSYIIPTLPNSSDPFIWITAESSERGGFSIFTFHTNKISGHSSGEHNF